jgi:hypothetical protein
MSAVAVLIMLFLGLTWPKCHRLSGKEPAPQSVNAAMGADGKDRATARLAALEQPSSAVAEVSIVRGGFLRACLFCTFHSNEFRGGSEP